MTVNYFAALVLGLLAVGGSLNLQAAEGAAASVSAAAKVPEQALKVEKIAASVSDPHELVEQTLRVLREFSEVARGYADQDPERYFADIQTVLDPVLNFDRFARNVMAAPYKRATPEQRARFTETFKRGLIQTYSLALTEFDEGELSVLPAADDEAGRRTRVKTEIRTPAGDVFPVVYALGLEKDERWRIYNIVANGVNLGLTFRNQFQSAWQSNDRDIDKTIDAWATIVGES